ncbi:MAG: hypothetical protein F4X02_06320 [Chloroflexi bacterium]|nr:hypothetical protein [Chloroflexota bacterium]
MVSFRTIDRDHIILRRAEASACLHHGLNHSAALTACSGIELLLEYLVSRLYEDLNRTSRRKANSLHKRVEDEERRNSAKTTYWGLGRWVDMYKRQSIFAALSAQYDFSFRTLNEQSLSEANEIWNKCKHDPYLATRENAARTVQLLTSCLAETQFELEQNEQLQVTVGAFGAHWLHQWEEPLLRWVATNQDSPQTKILLCLAPFLDVLIRLIDDDRVTYEFKTPLMVAVNYVFSTLDLMPEDEDKLSVDGLVDDGAVLVLTLHWLMHKDPFAKELLIRHWPGGESIVEEIEALKQHIWAWQQDLFPETKRQFGSQLVWKVLQKIAIDGPEALWQNYWQEEYRTGA